MRVEIVKMNEQLKEAKIELFECQLEALTQRLKAMESEIQDIGNGLNDGLEAVHQTMKELHEGLENNKSCMELFGGLVNKTIKNILIRLEQLENE